ncbi:MAG: flagellar assembly protein FliW [Rhodospirillales bacterium]|nr:flagellar assembly protein FliW [Rhodospirillales bacterium]
MPQIQKTPNQEEREFIPPLSTPSLEAEHEPERFTIETRFGTVEVNPDNKLHFRSGMLGFGAATEFVLIDLENPKYELFRMLQCINDPSLSFIVFPPNLESGLIDRSDIEAAAKAVNMNFDDLVVLLLVTVRGQDDGNNTLSVNLRAPVLVDSVKFTGIQYVMPNDKYPTMTLLRRNGCENWSAVLERAAAALAAYVSGAGGEAENLAGRQILPPSTPCGGQLLPPAAPSGGTINMGNAQ